MPPRAPLNYYIILLFLILSIYRQTILLISEEALFLTCKTIALLKNNCITIHEGDMLAFSHLIQQRRKNTLTSLQ